MTVQNQKQLGTTLSNIADELRGAMNLRFGAIAKHSGATKVMLSKYYNIFYCDQSVDSRFCEIYFKSDSMIAFYDNMATGTLLERYSNFFQRRADVMIWK